MHYNALKYEVSNSNSNLRFNEVNIAVSKRHVKFEFDPTRLGSNKGTWCFHINVEFELTVIHVLNFKCQIRVQEHATSIEKYLYGSESWIRTNAAFIYNM